MNAVPENPSNRPETVLKVFLFTDVVGSVDLKRRLGDARGADAIARHDALFRKCLARFAGVEQDNAGDGFLAIFDVPSNAVRCALAFQRGLSDLDVSERLNVRIGIHMGEIVSISDEEADRGADKLVGLAVDTAARVMGLAQGRQILTTRETFDSARQQLSSAPDGSPLRWLAHGPYAFQGLDAPLEVFEVGIESLSFLAPPPDSEKAKRGIAPGEEDTLGWRPAAGLTIPQRPNWSLQEQLGEGGYGEVWLAVHEKSKVQRVFKFCFDPERVRGLRREVVLFRLLRETLGDREDIVQILDWQFDKPPYFLESEYTAAGDLFHWAETKGGVGAIPLETRLELVAQTAVALAAAHSVGVLHKDVKPSNILITEITERGEPRASLTDFGIGLITKRGALEAKGITAVGLTKTLMGSSSSSQSGTRLYMAPEVIEGKPSTTLSDIYSLGVVLYQMVIGDFSRAVASGWERDVDDELLREDIAACVDGRSERRLTGATELAERLRALEQRRKQREEERQAKEAAANAKQIVEQTRRRLKVFIAVACAGILFTTATIFLAVRENRQARHERELSAQAREASALAEQRAEEAEQVVGILSDMFTVSDPYQGANLYTGAQASTGIEALREAQGNAVTARDLLDVGADRVLKGLGDQPLVQAQLLNTFGNAYSGLAQYGRASEMLEAALDIRRKLLPERDPRLAETLHNLAWALFSNAKRAEAEPYIREAVEIRRDASNPSPDFAASLVLLASIHEQNARLDLAVSTRREADDYLRNNFPQYAGFPVNQMSLAELLIYQNAIADGRALSEEAEATARKIIPGDDPALGIVLKLRGVNLRRLFDYEGSVRSLLESQAILARSLGEKHPDFAHNLLLLGHTLRASGDYLAAEESLRQSLEIVQRTLGNEHPETATTAVNLMASIQDMASLSQFQGDFTTAEQLYRRALGLIRATSGDDQIAFAIATVELARLLKAQGRPADAAPVFREAIQKAEAVLGAGHDLPREYREELNAIAPLSGDVERTLASPSPRGSPVASEISSQSLEDHMGLWRGRAMGSGVNVEIFYDRWLEDGVVKGVVTCVPFFIASEEITVNADGSLATSYPSILGYTEAVYTVSLPNEIHNEKTARAMWSQANGVRGGEAQTTWIDPALNKTLSDAELTGGYHGELWPGISASERIEVTMDLTIRGNEVRGEVRLPVETLEVIKGRRFNNRILLEVRGETIRGLMVGSASVGKIRFHWDMGVGYGQAEFQKTDEESGEDGEP